MRKHLLLPILLFLTINACSQSNAPRIEAYTAPGLFLEKLNSDTLVPAKRRNKSRFGDVVSFGVQFAVPLRNKRWFVKAGAGYSVRHYSLNKYNIGDVIGSFFTFNSPYRSDSSLVSYVRLTNRYFQVPVSVAWTLIRNAGRERFKFTAGLNIRSDFLNSSDAAIRTESSLPRPTAAGLFELQRKYSAGAAKWVVTIEPYIEYSFFVYRHIGMYGQLRPLSFYASRLNNQYTSATNELFSFTTGIFYSFHPAK